MILKNLTTIIYELKKFYSFTFNINCNFSRKATDQTPPRHQQTTKMWTYGVGDTPKKLKLATWNVNGIRAIITKGSLQSYLNTAQPDIICLNQTKIDLSGYIKDHQKITSGFNKFTTIKTQQHHLNNLSKFGQYYSYWNFCKVSGGYSGVLTLSKYLPIRATQDFPLNHHLSLEGRCLTLEFNKFYLLNCYIPNAGSVLERLHEKTSLYNKKFQQYLKVLQTQKNVLICGDFNVAHKQIDICRPKQNERTAGFTKEERLSFDQLLRENKLIDSYRYFNPNTVEYTWWSPRTKSRQKNIGWRIDYILSSNPKILRQVQIKNNVMGSDHCPVQCQLQF